MFNLTSHWNFWQIYTNNEKTVKETNRGMFWTVAKEVCMYTIFWRGKLAVSIDPRPRFWLMCRWANCLEKHGPPLASMFSPFPLARAHYNMHRVRPSPPPLAEMGLMANDTILNVFLSVRIPNPECRSLQLNNTECEVCPPPLLSLTNVRFLNNLFKFIFIFKFMGSRCDWVDGEPNIRRLL